MKNLVITGAYGGMGCAAPQRARSAGSATMSKLVRLLAGFPDRPQSSLPSRTA